MCCSGGVHIGWRAWFVGGSEWESICYIGISFCDEIRLTFLSWCGYRVCDRVWKCVEVVVVVWWSRAGVDRTFLSTWPSGFFWCLSKMVSVADDSIYRRTWKKDQKGYDDPSVGSTKGHGIGNSVDAMKSGKSHKSRDEFETSRERFRTLINRRIMRFGFAGVHCGMFLFYFSFHEGGWIQCLSLFMCRRWWKFRRQRHSALSFVLSPIIPLQWMIRLSIFSHYAFQSGSNASKATITTYRETKIFVIPNPLKK